MLAATAPRFDDHRARTAQPARVEAVRARADPPEGMQSTGGHGDVVVDLLGRVAMPVEDATALRTLTRLPTSQTCQRRDGGVEPRAASDASRWSRHDRLREFIVGRSLLGIPSSLVVSQVLTSGSGSLSGSRPRGPLSPPSRQARGCYVGDEHLADVAALGVGTMLIAELQQPPSPARRDVSTGMLKAASLGQASDCFW